MAEVLTSLWNFLSSDTPQHHSTEVLTGLWNFLSSDTPQHHSTVLTGLWNFLSSDTPHHHCTEVLTGLWNFLSSDTPQHHSTVLTGLWNFLSSDTPQHHSTVLTGLWNFLSSDTPQHHRTDCLKERGVWKWKVPEIPSFEIKNNLCWTIPTLVLIQWQPWEDGWKMEPFRCYKATMSWNLKRHDLCHYVCRHLHSDRLPWTGQSEWVRYCSYKEKGCLCYNRTIMISSSDKHWAVCKWRKTDFCEWIISWVNRYESENSTTSSILSNITKSDWVQRFCSNYGESCIYLLLLLVTGITVASSSGKIDMHQKEICFPVKIHQSTALAVSMNIVTTSNLLLYLTILNHINTYNA